MKIETIDNWSRLLEILETTSYHKEDYMGRTLQFRGQSNFDWDLTSSLQRLIIGDTTSESKALYYEKQSRLEYLSQSHLLRNYTSYDNEKTSFEVLIDMQHYSCPTRLVDWSGSPYVALYFAVRENLESDGALYLWNTANYYYNMLAAGKDYTEVPYSQILEFDKYDFVQLVFPTRKNERLVRQQGCFSISNNILQKHCELINTAAFGQNNTAGIFKLKIPHSIKLDFLARLRTMNISANSLFPGFDGLGKSIDEMLKLRKWAKR